MEVIHQFISNNTIYFDYLCLMFLILSITNFGLFSNTPKLSKYDNHIGHRYTYFFLIFTTLLLNRLHSLFIDVEFNVDESQFIVAANTLLKKGGMWKYVDVTTSGPLNVYPIVFLGYLGIKINYFTTRILALILLYGSIICFFNTLKNFYNEYVARLGILTILFTFFVKCIDVNFIHYNSEYISVLLLNLATWGISIIWKEKNSLGALFLTGLMLGSLPFAKLQSVPIGVGLSIVTLYILYKQKKTISNYLTFIIGGLSTAIFFIGYIAYYNAFSEFWQFYILSNLNYASSNSYDQNRGIIETILIWVLNLIYTDQSFLLIPCIILIALTFIFKNKGYNSVNSFRKVLKYDTISLLSTVYILFSTYSILKSKCIFTHYLVFLPFPLCFSTISILRRCTDLKNGFNLLPKLKNIKKKYIISGGIILMCGVLLIPIINPFKSIKLYPFYVGTPSRAKTISIIKKHLKNTDDLAIWGYELNIQMQSNTLMATPQPHNYHMLTNSIDKGVEKYQYENYLYHLKRNKPMVFVDFDRINNDILSKSFEHFEKLREIILNDYHLVYTVKDNYLHRETLIRVYQLNEDSAVDQL